MSTLQGDRRKGTHTRSFGTLTDETHRGIVRIVRGRTGAVSEQDLAEGLGAASSESKSAVTSTDAAESLRARLYHVHLPKLADDGLVDWDREERTVAATDHPVYDAQRVEEPVSTDEWDSIGPVLADDRRRELLAVLASENEPVTREELARELAAAEANGQPAATLVEDVGVQLHHSHLPKLEEAGLVEYDVDDATVAYRGPSELATALRGNASDDLALFAACS